MKTRTTKNTTLRIIKRSILNNNIYGPLTCDIKRLAG